MFTPSTVIMLEELKEGSRHIGCVVQAALAKMVAGS